MGGEAVLAGQAEIAPPLLGLEGPLFAGARPAVGYGRQELEERVVGDALEEQGTALGQKVRALGRVEGREGSVLREAADLPLEDDAHGHGLAAPVAEALERDADLDRVAVGVDPPPAVPDDIDRVILDAALESGISLDAEGVDVQRVKPLLVVEGIQIDADPVIDVDGVPAADRGLDLLGLRVGTPEGEVEVFPVVGVIDYGPGRHVLAVVRVPRLEAGFAGRPRPDLVVEDAVDLRRDLRPGRPERLEGGRGFGAGRGRREGCEHREAEEREDRALRRHVFSGIFMQ